VTLDNVETLHLLVALSVLLAAAHLGGFLAVRLHQPRVAGEILGAFLLGPTLFGALLPEWQRALFYGRRSTTWIFAAIYQLGLFLLMYCAGAAVHPDVRRDEVKDDHPRRPNGQRDPVRRRVARS
jgi:Kef-type K+ transport system membrane component KefB